VRDGASGVVVASVIADSSAAASAPDVRADDRIVAILGKPVTSLVHLMAAYDSATVGASITLRIARGSAPEHMLRFPKPAPAAGGQRMMVVGGDAGGAGVWSMSNAPAGVGRVVIAGAHLADNTQGMPEVTHRESHPAASMVPLRIGDVVTAVNGASVAALRGVELLYGRLSVGDSVQLVVKRGGSELVLRFAKPADR